MESLFSKKYTEASGNEAIGWLEKYQSALSTHRERLSLEKDLLIDSLKQAAGGAEEFLQLKRTYHNNQVADLVLNRNELHKIIKRDGFLLRRMEPIYMYPVKKNGRAHFYASVKRYGNLNIPTVVVNLVAIWIMTLVLYVLLRYSALRLLLNYLGELRHHR